MYLSDKIPKSSSLVLMRILPTLWTGLRFTLRSEVHLGGSLSLLESLPNRWVVSLTTSVSLTLPNSQYVADAVDGMTSLSVRQYIYGVLKAHGLNEKEVTKFQTGGPDGDLGSSESES